MDNDLLSSILCESYKTFDEKNLCVSHDLYFIGELHHKIRMLLRFYRRNNFKSWDSIISLDWDLWGWSWRNLDVSCLECDNRLRVKVICPSTYRSRECNVQSLNHEKFCELHDNPLQSKLDTDLSYMPLETWVWIG